MGGEALIVVDMQRGFMEPTLPGIPYLEDSVQVRSGVESAVHAARDSGFAVIFTQHALRAGGEDVPVWLQNQIPTGWMVRGSEATHFWPTLTPEPDEPVVVKNRFDAFLYTELDQVLRLRSIDSLYVCGILTNYCVESTAKSAMQRDYRVTVLGDATAATDFETHRRALDALRSYTIEVKSSSEIFEDSGAGAQRSGASLV
jgi:nicotinamidase-related amidase